MTQYQFDKLPGYGLDRIVVGKVTHEKPDLVMERRLESGALRVPLEFLDHLLLSGEILRIENFENPKVTK
jgi:hypothetical protein